MITIEEFKKLEIKIGRIISAEKVEGTDKLLRLMVDFGEMEGAAGAETTSAQGRQIVSGISLYYPDLSVLIGKKCAFATNLEPRTIKGFESHGMILAVSGDEFFSLLEVLENVPAGSAVK